MLFVCLQLWRFQKNLTSKIIQEYKASFSTLEINTVNILRKLNKVYK